MNYLHYTVRADPSKIIRVSLSEPANVRLLDTLNYYKYRVAKVYESVAESTSDTKVSFTPPHKGEWHVVVDLAGQGSEVRAFVEVLDGRKGP
jgi:hypothetical protein